MVMPDKSELAKGWIAYWSRPPAERTAAEEDEIFVLNDLARDQPQLCWEMILEIVATVEPDPATSLFQVLAAGPLEELLASHGEAFIGRVETLARENPQFKLLLGGVWQNTMSQDVWERVQQCRGEAW
jgi:hypothetical protein